MKVLRCFLSEASTFLWLVKTRGNACARGCEPFAFVFRPSEALRPRGNVHVERHDVEEGARPPCEARGVFWAKCGW